MAGGCSYNKPLLTNPKREPDYISKSFFLQNQRLITKLHVFAHRLINRGRERCGGGGAFEKRGRKTRMAGKTTSGCQRVGMPGLGSRLSTY